MPKSAPTPCRYPGCAQVLSTHGYCAQHQTKVHRDYSRARKGFDTELGFYRSARWRNTCAAVLRGNPVYCVLQLAKVVDHIVPIKLSAPTCGDCACPVSTRRPRQRPPHRASKPPTGGGGGKSLQIGDHDAWAWSIFSACKLKQGGVFYLSQE